jgi:hypothetical protein
MKLKVKFIKDFPYQTVGEDLKVYGPFKNGEIAELPFLYANVLVSRGFAVIA